MDWIQIIIAIVLGLAFGYVLTRKRNVDYSKIHTIGEQDFKDNMRKGQLIDIRPQEQYDQDKIKGARHFTPKMLTSKYNKLRKDQSIYLYCSNGKKSKKIAKKLASQNYTDIYVLDGGYDNLTK